MHPSPPPRVPVGRPCGVRCGAVCRCHAAASGPQVMSTVEGKTPLYFTRDVREGDERGEWGTDIYKFRGEELSYALGREGSTKKKLARAADCIMEYVGEFAYISGVKEERRRGMRYLRWLLKQRSGAVRLVTCPPPECRARAAR